MKYKLLALDIDETLVSRGKNISDRNRRALDAAKEKGVYVTVATGRASKSALPFIRQVGIEGMVVTYGGAIIIDSVTEKLISAYYLDSGLLSEIAGFTESMGLYTQIYQQDDVVIHGYASPFADEYCRRTRMSQRIIPDYHLMKWENVPKMLCFTDADKTSGYIKKITERFGDVLKISVSNPEYIEVNSKLCNKGNAIKEIAGKMGIDMAEVAAMGDNTLDLELLEMAGLSAAVANGGTEAKEAADLVAPSCDEDGVAWFIENYIL